MPSTPGYDWRQPTSIAPIRTSSQKRAARSKIAPPFLIPPSLYSVSSLVLAVVVLPAVSRRERHSAQHLARLRFTNSNEAAQRSISIVVALRGRQSRSFQQVGDLYQFVRVRALIPTGANRRRYRINVHPAVAVNFAGDIAAAVGRRIQRRGIIRHAIRHADIQTVLQHVVHVPCAAAPQAPFLHTRRG